MLHNKRPRDPMSSGCRRPHEAPTVSRWSFNGTLPVVVVAAMENRFPVGATSELQWNIVGVVAAAMGRRWAAGATASVIAATAMQQRAKKHRVDIATELEDALPWDATLIACAQALCVGVYSSISWVVICCLVECDNASG